MMLADHIIQSAKNPKGMNPFFTDFGKAVAAAVPFEIEPDVGRIAHAVQQSDGKRLLAIHEFCRVPFKSSWFEWVGPSASFGTTIKSDARTEETAPRPDRCGALVEVLDDDMSAAMVSFAWSHKQYGVNVSPYSFLFDWAGKNRIPKVASKMALDDIRKAFPKHKNDSDDDLNRLEARAEVLPNPRLVKLWMAVEARGAEYLEAFKANAISDCEGEGGFVEGLLATLNSRNLSSVSEPCDMSKINKARRRMGRPELLSFRTVRLSLSRGVERRRGQGTGDPLPLHMVRGHFKVRKSGIYWWSPFWRGDAAIGVVSRSGYQVAA